jgi:hypothetical protein
MPTPRFLPYASLLAGACWALSSASLQANPLYTVSLTTAPLSGHSAAPFYLDFQLNDGRGAGDGNNTVTLSHFQFGVGGNAAGTPLTQGGASGDLLTAVVIHDNNALLNDFHQEFIPGDTLSFDLDLTTQVDSPTPDEFSFALLDNTLAELPTQGPFDVLATIDITSPSPRVQTFASDPTRSPRGGGPGITINVPTLQAIPEPPTGALLLAGVGGLLWTVQRRKESEVSI